VRTCGSQSQRNKFAGANLSQADFAGRETQEANLEEADLQGAWGANLTGANLLCAELEGANLTGVNLTGTCLVGTYMNQLAIADVSKTQSSLKQQPHDAKRVVINANNQSGT